MSAPFHSCGRGERDKEHDGQRSQRPKGLPSPLARGTQGTLGAPTEVPRFYVRLLVLTGTALSTLQPQFYVAAGCCVLSVWVFAYCQWVGRMC